MIYQSRNRRRTQMIDVKESKFLYLKTAAAAGFLVILIACGKGGPPASSAPEVAVTEIKAQRVVLTTVLPARVAANLVADIRPQVSGIIKQRYFEEGAEVKAGATLYQIDPAQYKAAHDNAKASLSRSEANFYTVKMRAERYKGLVDSKAISQQEYDDADAAFKQAEADVQYWKAALDAAKINLDYTAVKAPISGRIGKSNVTVGALVTAGQPSPLAVVQKIDKVYVDATQSSSDLLQLKKSGLSRKISDKNPGKAKVRLFLEDGSVYQQEGTLEFSDISVDQSTGTFILRMEFQNPDAVLLPGMFVKAQIEEGTAENAILVPQQGVSRDPKGQPYSMVVNSENKVEQKMLKIERAIGEMWLVTDGINPGDRVIMEGIQRVRPGSDVKPVVFEPKTATGSAPPASKS
jgi:membrane fusion protein, multidrug efflux system